MAALVGVRALTNNAKPSAGHAAHSERAIGTLQDLSYAGDDYKAYETASAISAEITKALAKGPVEDERAVVSSNGLVKQHETIICSNPKKLGNQAVVAVFPQMVHGALANRKGTCHGTQHAEAAQYHPRWARRGANFSAFTNCGNSSSASQLEGQTARSGKTITKFY
jgi:hypothetical protein